MVTVHAIDSCVSTLHLPRILLQLSLKRGGAALFAGLGSRALLSRLGGAISQTLAPTSLPPPLASRPPRFPTTL